MSQAASKPYTNSLLSSSKSPPATIPAHRPSISKGSNTKTLLKGTRRRIPHLTTKWRRDIGRLEPILITWNKEQKSARQNSA
ncbi:hypothetical protein RUND412_000553 [Rhizina undulata]